MKQKIDDAFAANTFARTMFDEAKDEIYFLMSKDNFARFKKSKYFKQLQSDVQVYDSQLVDTDEVEVVTRRLSEKDKNKDRAILSAAKSMKKKKKGESGDLSSIFSGEDARKIAEEAEEEDNRILSGELEELAHQAEGSGKGYRRTEESLDEAEAKRAEEAGREEAAAKE